jgi:hypothetical protein
VPHKIVSKTRLAENIFTADIEAPLGAHTRKPGQFVIVIISNEYGERIPLTIADADPKRGTIRLIWQRVGKTTTELADMNVGDEIAAVAGPLGRPTHIDNFGTVVCVDGSEFDGYKVNFDLMIKRLDAYKNQEQHARELYEKQRCKIGLDKHHKLSESN